jgi:hypothetical protein
MTGNIGHKQEMETLDEEIREELDFLIWQLLDVIY